ncbi:SAM-dependent methyltransferase [Duganella sp. Leaf126]|uniref:methyltransferase domain-containing protein n=1 Tax=Duganella sp. Leaf126 TaxID=1736266 RepID=UPI00070079F7|nr:methyltransferase domain-containing protein [Duganella sp. Leaf126]KQQ47573.1 SAM-dependent methyltransferase [Duganella sp. Leaf126]
MSDFLQRDPLTPAFWDERFERRFTPWDRGTVSPALRRFVAAHAPMTTLIPGCGAARELLLLRAAGWNATAIDFSPAAVAVARQLAGPHAEHVVVADFFAWQPTEPLQLIYEQAFLCAMPPAVWPRLAARWAQLLPAGALLAGCFLVGDGFKGPPFAITRSALDALLQPAFVCETDDVVDDAIAVFAGMERWMVWRRR